MRSRLIKLLRLLPAMFPLFGLTQSKITVSGYIQETGSKELLPFASIYVKPAEVATSSNSYGFFSITVPSTDSLEIYFTCFGYHGIKKVIPGNANAELTIELISEDVELTEVVITANEQKKISEDSRMSTIDIPIAQIKKIPALLGEKDVLKVIQLMPGVQKGSEGSSGIYVRGGGPDQNLIILDDATVYNVSHLFGFFSLFNGDALKGVELTKGGFPARYGGRLSSVIEMQMKDGNKEKLTGEAGIGIISSRLTLEGPIIKNKASFLVSARRTYIDALIYPFLKDENKGGYFFYDLNAKMSYNVDAKNKLYLSGYFGKDKFYFKSERNTTAEKVNLNWGNATGTFRWNHQFNQKIFANTSLIFSDFKFNVNYNYKQDDESFILDYYSGIRDFTLKSDADFFPNPNHHLRVGVMGTYHKFTPSAIVIESSYIGEDLTNKTGLDAWETAAYVEDDWKITKKLKANMGFRLSHFVLGKINYINPEPRISARYMLGEDLSVKASYCIMNQYIHLLSNTGLGLPTDLWVPSTDNVKPQNSQQFAVGVAKDFADKGFMVSLEGYYKKSKNIIGYKEGASFLTIEDPATSGPLSWEGNVTPGNAESYGLEFFIQRKYGKFTGWIGYTLSWTYLQFDSLNFGKRFYAKYDRRHDISVVGTYEFNERITLSATWVFGSGNAITLPLESYNAYVGQPGATPQTGNIFGQYYVTGYTERNAFRMAPYHRFDVAVQFHKQKKRYERIFELGVYNLYNRKNPFYYYINYDREGNSSLWQVSLFPVIPSVSWTFKF